MQGDTSGAGQALARSAINRLMKPRSIAILGASDRPGSLGASVLANLVRAGFDGDIHLVNAKRDSIGDRPCVRSVDDLPAGIDVAILAIPQAGVLDAVRSLAPRGCGAAVIFSAGFAEGGAEGMAQQQEIARIAREAGMVIEGPNCLGLVNFVDKVPLTFIELPEAKAQGDRRIGVVSQSGAMAAVVATTMIAREVPLSCYISTGNEAASGVEDYIDYLSDDPQTAVIAMIVEHFRKPQAFLAAAAKAMARGKQIVLLHPGSSEAGRESAATHTGAMAGDHDVMRTLVERAGVILAEGLEELGDIAEIALRCPTLPVDNVAVVSESGALKAMVLDRAEKLGITLPKLSDEDSPALREALPPFVPVTNPLDVTAQGLVDPGIYSRTLNALNADDRVATIFVPLIQTDFSTSGIKFSAVAGALEENPATKPIIVAGVDEGGGVREEDVARLRKLGVPYFPTPERVLQALSRFADASRRSTGVTDKAAVDVGGGAAGEVIPEYRSKELLAAHGVSFSPCRMATDIAGARGIAAELGYPVVLKAQSPLLSHKSDAGGVIINIADEAALDAAWDRLAANIAQHRPGLVLDGVLVEKMAPKGVEMIVGARVDPEWGPVVLVGFGGVTAELLKDVALLPPDLSREDIIAEVRKLRMAPLLTGFRGAAPCDLDALAAIVEALGRVVRGTPSIREVDLNPVLVMPKGQGAVALDALISC
ncbi:6-carboxyhexanoate--CoA ligase [Sphingobium jiangsuense]|uniref:Acyl-CoA synthetase (NDP forming) n=1 Tax=Sphingobium jiangsuense TaxID=870476 RepID=A0A7W6BRK6_9SPHN|nr:acetate--CoA ligase family protein [Sphingobium jiangsuense]MBB3928522.1 acyl-CoA synthetase (NDP forming) [Sphingobium jiangsuense]GLT01550.1 6-carboxyhexanoate--CoA ligase [Sphingobium jiangsuense]